MREKIIQIRCDAEIMRKFKEAAKARDLPVATYARLIFLDKIKSEAVNN